MMHHCATLDSMTHCARDVIHAFHTELEICESGRYIFRVFLTSLTNIGLKLLIIDYKTEAPPRGSIATTHVVRLKRDSTTML